MLLLHWLFALTVADHMSDTETHLRRPAMKPQAELVALEARPLREEPIAQRQSAPVRTFDKRMPVWRGLSRAESLVSQPKRLNFTKIDLAEEVREQEIGGHATSSVPYSEKPFQVRKRSSSKARRETVQNNNVEINATQHDPNPLKKKKKKRAKKSSPQQ